MQRKMSDVRLHLYMTQHLAEMTQHLAKMTKHLPEMTYLQTFVCYTPQKNYPRKGEGREGESWRKRKSLGE